MGKTVLGDARWKISWRTFLPGIWFGLIAGTWFGYTLHAGRPQFAFEDAVRVLGISRDPVSLFFFKYDAFIWAIVPLTILGLIYRIPASYVEWWTSGRAGLSGMVLRACLKACLCAAILVGLWALLLVVGAPRPVLEPNLSSLYKIFYGLAYVMAVLGMNPLFVVIGLSGVMGLIFVLVELWTVDTAAKGGLWRWIGYRWNKATGSFYGKAAAAAAILFMAVFAYLYIRVVGDTSGAGYFAGNERVFQSVKKAEFWQFLPHRLNIKLGDLDKELGKTGALPEGAASEVTRRLVGIYSAYGESVGADRIRSKVLNIISNNDNGKAAQGFFIKILTDGDAQQRKDALRAISNGKMRGSEFYDSIRTVAQKEDSRIAEYLPALAKVEPGRGKAEALRLLAGTEDFGQFERVGEFLCSYDDPDLMDIVADRYEYFKRKNTRKDEVVVRRTSWGMEETESVYYSMGPKRAFASKVLRKYIEARDGERLRIAIEIYKEQTGGMEREDIPIFEKKLASGDVISRETMIDYLEYNLNKFIDNKFLFDMLRTAERAEADARLKNKVSGILKKGDRGRS